MAPDAYEHEPLDESRQQIRLFKLSREPPGSPWIRGTLNIFDLETCPPFMALSYAWASARKMKMIWIDGKPLKVRRNLFYFFREFIAKDGPRFLEAFSGLASETGGSPFDAWLWIDQICIHQDSLEEKNQQVPLMAQIYSWAERVIAWLGRKGGRTTYAMEALGNIVPEPSAKASIADACRIINLKPYWKRLWIIQELLLARDITILCGTTVLQWPHPDIWSQLKIMPTGNTFFRLMFMQTQLRYYGADLDYALMTFAVFAESLCTNLRDKIYGFCGILPVQFRLNLRPDYSRSTQDVFVDLLRAYVCYKQAIETGEHELRGLQESRFVEPNLWMLLILGLEMGVIPKTTFKNDYSSLEAGNAVEETTIGQLLSTIWRSEQHKSIAANLERRRPAIIRRRRRKLHSISKYHVSHSTAVHRTLLTPDPPKTRRPHHRRIYPPQAA